MFSQKPTKVNLPSGNSVDLKTNRNEEMIKALISPNANGMFLFYLEGITTNIIMPPGLTNDEIEEFRHEFLNLFEKFATKANKRI